MGLGYALGEPVMMQLGDYQFGLKTAAYQGASRSDDWRWPSQERFGAEAALQYVGPGDTTMTLEGVIYPEWRGGQGQLASMRAEAGKGKPLVLVNGLGQALGMWVIESISDDQSTFAAGGVARKIEFSLSLRRYSSAVSAPVPTLPPLPKPPAPVPAEAPARAALLSESMASQVRPMLVAANAAYKQLQAHAAPIRSVLADATGAVKRCAEVAQQVQAAGVQAAAMLKLASPSASARIMRVMQGDVQKARARAASAHELLQRTIARIDEAPADAARAIVSASGVSDGLVKLCRAVIDEAEAIIGEGE